MNTPSTVTSSNAPDFDALLTEAQPAQREGLPNGFRMRASAHYVDQLDQPAGPTLRAIAVAAIESEPAVDAPDTLVDSIRRHGVIEPLLVQHDPRGRCYRLIAGRRRLAAVRAAGLRDVPCIVHVIADADAATLRDAIRQAQRRDPPAAPVVPDETASFRASAHRDLESALSSIDSCARLLGESSVVARRGAAQVIAGECQRAQRLLTAIRVLSVESPVRRVPLNVGELLTRVQCAIMREQELAGLESTIEIAGDVQTMLYGDSELLLTALTGASSAIDAVTGARPRHIVLTATAPAGRGPLVLELTDRSVTLPESFARSALVMPWPVADGETALLLLRAAQRIASVHGGSVTIASHTGTTIRFQLPCESTRRHASDRSPGN